MLPYGAPGIFPTPRGLPSNVWDLQAGAARLIPPGTWNTALDAYSCMQEYDPVQNQWVTVGGDSSVMRQVNSDGNNYRLVNQQGCVIGASVTNGGTGYIAAPAVSSSAGGAMLTAIVGGAVSTSVSVTNAGAGYVYPPLVFLDPPPQGAGLQATGFANLTGGVVSSITISNQGAGYTNVPNVYIIPDPRDVGPSTPASATASLTGAQTVTGILVNNYGTPLTTIPTISFSAVNGGSGAIASPIMVRSIGAFTVVGAGSGYSGTVIVSGLGNGSVPAPALTNPKWTTGLVRTRNAQIVAGTTATGGLSALGQTVNDGGIYASSNPTPMIYGSLAAGGTLAATVAFTWANNNSTVALYPT